LGSTEAFAHGRPHRKIPAHRLAQGLRGSFASATFVSRSGLRRASFLTLPTIGILLAGGRTRSSVKTNHRAKVSGEIPTPLQ